MRGKSSRRVIVILLCVASMIFFSRQAFALVYSDFTVFGNEKVLINQNSKIAGPGETGSVYTGKIGTNDNTPVPSGYNLELLSGVQAGDLYSNGTTKVGQNDIIKGKVVSNGDLEIISGSTFTGNVNSGGAASIGQNTVFNSDVTAAGLTTFSSGVHVKGNVLSGSNLTAGNNGQYDGNAGVNGNVVLGSSTHVNGHVTHSGTLTLNGSGVNKATVGSESTGTSTVSPETFATIALPAATSFTAGGTDVTLGGATDTTLAPGTYGDLSIGSNSKLRLSSGSYFFDSIDANGGLDIYMNLSGGDLLLYILGNVDFGTNLDVFLSNGTAKNVYSEAHGSWLMRSGGTWYGTIYTPYDSLTIGQNCTVYGALYSGDEVEVQSTSTIRYSLSNHLNPPSETVIPEPGTMLLMGIGLAAAVLKRRRNSN